MVAHYNLGRALHDIGNLAAAEKHLETALRLIRRRTLDPERFDRATALLQQIRNGAKQPPDPA